MWLKDNVKDIGRLSLVISLLFLVLLFLHKPSTEEILESSIIDESCEYYRFQYEYFIDDNYREADSFVDNDLDWISENCPDVDINNKYQSKTFCIREGINYSVVCYS